MKVSAIAAAISFVATASAAVIPVQPTGAGPFSFMIESDNERYHGKWLAPAAVSTKRDKEWENAVVSNTRFRSFFITSHDELTYTSSSSSPSRKTNIRTAKINDWIQDYPYLAQVTFNKADPAKVTDKGFDESEKTFQMVGDGSFRVRGGKRWFACAGAAGEQDVIKVLVVGEDPENAKCSEITLSIVDGLA